MAPERWRQIEDIFNAALEREPPERPAFLENACSGDEALRRRVEALLHQDGQDGELLSQPIEKVVDECWPAALQRSAFPLVPWLDRIVSGSGWEPAEWARFTGRTTRD